MALPHRPGREVTVRPPRVLEPVPQQVLADPSCLQGNGVRHQVLVISTCKAGGLGEVQVGHLISTQHAQQQPNWSASGWGGLWQRTRSRKLMAYHQGRQLDALDHSRCSTGNAQTP